jgi:hypothetical protein
VILYIYIMAHGVRLKCHTGMYGPQSHKNPRVRNIVTGLFRGYPVVFYETTKKLNSVALSASELYRQSGRRRSAKLVQLLRVEGCHVVSTTGPHGR